MPALYPTFQLLAYNGPTEADGMIPAGVKIDQYACATGAWELTDEGFVLNGKYMPDRDAWASIGYTGPDDAAKMANGPRSIVCTADLGPVTSLSVYVISTSMRRLIAQPAQTLATIGTCYGTVQTQEEIFLEGHQANIDVFVFNPDFPTTDAWAESDNTQNKAFDLKYGGGWDLQSTIEGSNTVSSLAEYEQIFEYIVPLDFVTFPSLNMALNFGVGGSSFSWAQIICGVRVNGILYGVNQDGNEELVDAGVLADQWWRDLKNCEQFTTPGQPGAGPPSGNFADGFAYGRDVESQKITAQEWNPPGTAQNEYDFFRDAYRLGVYFGIDSVLDDDYNSTESSIAQWYGQFYGQNDARYDLLVGGVTTDGVYFTLEPNGRRYTDPLIYAGASGVFRDEMPDQYNGMYNGYTDGFTDSLAGNPSDPAAGETGSALYNSSYGTGYIAGYADGPSDAGGDDAP